MKAHVISFDCRACGTTNPIPASKMLTNSYIECPACGVLNILSKRQRGLGAPQPASQPGELRAESE